MGTPSQVNGVTGGGEWAHLARWAVSPGTVKAPQQISDILSAIVTLDSQELKTGTKKQLERVLDFACGSGSLRLNVRHHSAVRSVVEAFGNRTGYNPVPLSLAFPAISYCDSDWDVASHVSPLTVSEAPSLASPLRLFFLSRWACLGFIGANAIVPSEGRRAALLRGSKCRSPVHITAFIAARSSE